MPDRAPQPGDPRRGGGWSLAPSPLFPGSTPMDSLGSPGGDWLVMGKMRPCPDHRVALQWAGEEPVRAEGGGRLECSLPGLGASLEGEDRPLLGTTDCSNC